MTALLWLLACDAPEDSADTGATCTGDLIHEVVPLSCADLARGVVVSTLEGLAAWTLSTEGHRVGDVLYAECSGTATLEIWNIPGAAVLGDDARRVTVGACGLVEEVHQTCPASGALPVTLDPDADALLLEVFGVPYTTPSGCGHTTATCPPGAPVRMVTAWSSAAEVGGVDCP